MYRKSLHLFERDVVRFSHRIVNFSTSSSRLDYFKYKSDQFIGRHIGPRENEKTEMLNSLGFKSMEQLIAATVPASIRMKKPLELSKPLTESELIKKLAKIASKNSYQWRSFIGMGYSNCHTPPVIMRNVLENPGELLCINYWTNTNTNNA